MTSPGVAAASASAVGQRASQRSQRGTTRSTCVCCDMTSLTRISYGSREERQGRGRPFSPNQAKSWASTWERLVGRAEGTQSYRGRANRLFNRTSRALLLPLLAEQD